MVPLPAEGVQLHRPRHTHAQHRERRAGGAVTIACWPAFRPGKKFTTAVGSVEEFRIPPTLKESVTSEFFMSSPVTVDL